MKIWRLVPLCLSVVSLAACKRIEEWLDKDKGGVTPPEITVVAVTDAMAYVEVGVYDEEADAEVGICWATHPSPDTTGQTMPLHWAAGKSAEIHGLAPETNYDARSYAVGSAGKTAFGREVEFSTDRQRPKVEVVACEVYDQSAEVACRAWGPRIECVGVCWNTGGFPTTEDGEFADCTYDAEQELWRVIVIGLEESRSYYLRGYVRTDDGYTYFSDDQFDFRTEEVYAPSMWIDGPVAREDTYADVIYHVNETGIIRRGLCWGTEPEPTVEGATTDDGSGGA